MLNRHNGVSDGRAVNQEILRKFEANSIEYAHVPELAFVHRLDVPAFDAIVNTVRFK